jgi:hypothetical protein
MPRRKLNESQVYEIRRRYRFGEMQKVLAREYGVCAKTIHIVVRGSRVEQRRVSVAYPQWDKVSPVSGFRVQVTRKLLPQHVIDIRLRYQRGERLSRLSRVYGLSHANMKKVVLGHTYKWVN